MFYKVFLLSCSLFIHTASYTADAPIAGAGAPVAIAYDDGATQCFVEAVHVCFSGLMNRSLTLELFDEKILVLRQKILEGANVNTAITSTPVDAVDYAGKHALHLFAAFRHFINKDISKKTQIKEKGS